MLPNRGLYHDKAMSSSFMSSDFRQDAKPSRGEFSSIEQYQCYQTVTFDERPGYTAVGLVQRQSWFFSLIAIAMQFIDFASDIGQMQQYLRSAMNSFANGFRCDDSPGLHCASPVES